MTVNPSVFTYAPQAPVRARSTSAMFIKVPNKTCLIRRSVREELAGGTVGDSELRARVVETMREGEAGRLGRPFVVGGIGVLAGRGPGSRL